jgi:hypothetical protein
VKAAESPGNQPFDIGLTKSIATIPSSLYPKFAGKFV